MNAETLNAYTNMFLFVVIFGGVAYAIYRWSRPKTPPPDQATQRPEGFRPRARQEESEDEEFMSSPPITDWREMPTLSPMHTATAKPHSLEAPKPPTMKPPTMKSAILKSRKPKASTGSHSPYHKNDDVDVSFPVDVPESTEQKHCEPDRNSD